MDRIPTDHFTQAFKDSWREKGAESFVGLAVVGWLVLGELATKVELPIYVLTNCISLSVALRQSYPTGVSAAGYQPRNEDGVLLARNSRISFSICMADTLGRSQRSQLPWVRIHCLSSNLFKTAVLRLKLP